MPEKRTEPRARTRAILVKVSTPEHQLYGFIKDISNSGMGLRTFTASLPYPINVGESVRLEFSIPYKHVYVDCKAEVVWNCETNGGSGHMMRQGFRFTGIEPCIKEEIMDWVVDRL